MWKGAKIVVLLTVLLTFLCGLVVADRANEPTGLVPLTDYGFDDVPDVPDPDFQYSTQRLLWGSSGWSGNFWTGSALDEMQRTAMADAPSGDGYVLNLTFSPGACGNGPADVGFMNVGGESEVYASWVVKWDDDFFHNPTSNKMLQINLGSQNNYILWQYLWLEEVIHTYGDGLKTYYINALPVGERYSVINGQWVEYEFYLNSDTGNFTWWRNGQLRGSYSGLAMSPIDDLKMGGTWGGCQPSLPPGVLNQSQSRYTDNFYIGVPGSACQNGDNRSCGSSSVGACQLGLQTCSSGVWGSCVGSVDPVNETCGNSLDDDCNGQVDDVAVCAACSDGAVRSCGSDVGVCSVGSQFCSSGAWSTCIGGVQPVSEVCSDSLDNDCDGAVDEGCSVGLRGDFNLDGVIDFRDLVNVLSKLGRSGLVNDVADADLDGDVDLFDLVLVAKNWQRPVAPSITVSQVTDQLRVQVDVACPAESGWCQVRRVSPDPDVMIDDSAVNVKTVFDNAVLPGVTYTYNVRYWDADWGAESLQSEASITVQDVAGELQEFTDGFESGDLTGVQGGYWYNVVGAKVSDERARSGTYSLKFNYSADLDGGDSWEEIRARMEIASQEVWLEWYMYIPENYAHRTQANNEDNNKFLSMGTGDTMHGGWDQPGGWGWRMEVRPDAPSPSISRSALLYGFEGNGGGIGACATFGLGPCMVNEDNIISESDKGKWVQYGAHLKLASDQATSNGEFHFYKNGNMIVSNEGYPIGGVTTTNPIDSFELLGWSNSGYAQDTIFYIDDVRVYTEDPNWLPSACEITTNACDSIDNDCDGFVDEADECTVPINQTLPDFSQVTQDYLDLITLAGDIHWVEDAWLPAQKINYYDRSYAWYVFEYPERALVDQSAYMDEFFVDGASPRNWDTDGIIERYLQTGNATILPILETQAAIGVQLWINKGWTGLDPATAPWEGRIQERALLLMMAADVLDVPNPTYDYRAYAQRVKDDILATQNADGSWTSPATQYTDYGGNQVSTNFMSAAAMSAIIRYAEYYKEDEAAILNAVQRGMQWLWDTQYRPDGSFNYWSAPTPSNPDASTNPTADLNMLFVEQMGWLFYKTGDPVWIERGDALFSHAVETARIYEVGADKQFNQFIRNSWRYLYYRDGYELSHILNPTEVHRTSQQQPTYNSLVHALIDQEDFDAFDSFTTGASPYTDKYPSGRAIWPGLTGNFDFRGPDTADVEIDDIVTITSPGKGGTGNALELQYGGTTGASDIITGTAGRLDTIGELDGTLPEVAGPFTHFYFSTWVRFSPGADPGASDSSGIKGVMIWHTNNQRYQHAVHRLAGLSGERYPQTRWGAGGGAYPTNTISGRDHWKTISGEKPYFSEYNDGAWHQFTSEIYTQGDPSGNIGERVWLDGTLVFDNINDVESSLGYDYIYPVSHWMVFGNYVRPDRAAASPPFTVQFDDWSAWTDA